MSALTTGLWHLRRRSLAFAADYLVIAAYLAVLTMGMALVASLFPTAPEVLFDTPLRGQALGFLLVTLPVTLYFALSESSPAQATWGKRRLRLAVVDAGGCRLTKARGLARTALKFVPWELSHVCIWHASFAMGGPPCLVIGGFVLVWVLVGANVLSLLISSQNRTLYDLLSATRVVTRP